MYCSFDRTRAGTAGDRGRGDRGGPADAGFATVAAFNLNYFRPPFFALEAFDEVAAFVAACDLVVDDPQLSGMGRGELDRDGFLAGWNAGNRFAHGAIVAQHEVKSFHGRPEATLLAIWEWNRARRALQERIGSGVFVPRIAFFEIGGALRSGAVWPDALPVLLPEVEVVVVGRQELAPRRFLSRHPDVVALEWESVAGALAGFARVEGAVAHRALTYRHPPGELVRFVRELAPGREKIRAVPLDEVLSAELLAAAKGQGRAAAPAGHAGGEPPLGPEGGEP